MLTKWAVKALDGLCLKSPPMCRLFYFEDEWTIGMYKGDKLYEDDACLAPILAEIEARDWVYSAYGKGGAYEDYSIQLDCFNAYEEIEETFTVRAKTQLEVALTALFGVVRRDKL